MTLGRSQTLKEVDFLHSDLTESQMLTCHAVSGLVASLYFMQCLIFTDRLIVFVTSEYKGCHFFPPAL